MSSVMWEWGFGVSVLEFIRLLFKSLVNAKGISWLRE